MVVQHSMEAQAAPTKADSRTAMKKTASAAKESGSNAAREMSSTKTADETKPVAAAASPFTDKEILSFTGNFVKGTVVEHSMKAQAAPTKAGSRTAMENTTFTVKNSGSNVASKVWSSRRADRTTPEAAAASTFTNKEILSITGNFGTEAQQSMEAQAAPTKAGSRTATEKMSTAKDSGSNAASEVSSAITANRTMLVAGAANPLPDNEILSITGNFGIQHSMEAQAAPSKAGSRTATEEKTSAAEESGSLAASQVSNTRIADRTTPVAAAASPFTDNKLLSITGILGTVVQHSMEAQAAPTKADSRTAMEKTASAAKESGSNAAREVSSTKTADETKPVAAAASPFTDNEILSFTGNFGMKVQQSVEAQAIPTKAGSRTAKENTTSTNDRTVLIAAAKESGRHTASEEPSTRPTDRMAPVAAATRYFTYNEILSITKNFCQVIGEGSSSTVYYGQLPGGGLKVAVKKVKKTGSLLGNHLAEIKILMRIHHKNLVSLVGLCEEQDEIILVFEYMAGQSLSQILKDMYSRQSKGIRNKELPWRKRLQIALDAATGLEYLHTGCRPAIIHGDIKPADILLNENMQAKLAVNVTDSGTIGYIDHEYLYTQTLTKKDDVYSFGLVLFELITGKPAILITETNEKSHFTRWVMAMLIRGEIESLLDPLLKGRCNIQSVWEVAAIAKTAIQDPAGRPDMPQIVSTLKAALRMETSWVDMASESEMITSQSSFDGIPHNPVAAAASPFTENIAKESGSHAASKVSRTRTADRTILMPEAAHRFTYNEILSITENFGRVIGQGGSSTVYYGQLPETGVMVAVKKLKESGSQVGNLLKEIKILMRIHHRNLVSLVGFYVEQDEIILVSEYMANGSLSRVLEARANELPWRKRLQIALDAAIGLEYLHTGCKPSVIHRNIKPANILLDENLQAKLADFGLSKAGAVDGTEYSPYQAKVAGTLGYIDPEYLYTHTLTKKNDVYSFGVVLFELITGKPAIMITEANEKSHLTRWVMPMLMRGNIESLLDPLLKGQCNFQSVWEVAAIARTAIQDPAGRPDMPKIVSTLKAALSMETSWVETASLSETMTSQSSFDEIPHNPVAR